MLASKIRIVLFLACMAAPSMVGTSALPSSIMLRALLQGGTAPVMQTATVARLEEAFDAESAAQPLSSIRLRGGGDAQQKSKISVASCSSFSHNYHWIPVPVKSSLKSETGHHRPDPFLDTDRKPVPCLQKSRSFLGQSIQDISH